MRKYTPRFLFFLIVVSLIEIMVILNLWILKPEFVSLDGFSSLTIWAAVLMLIFLVFSVLGLINVDARIRNLHDAERRVESIETEMRSLLEEVRISAAKEKKNIVEKAEAEIVKIMDKSAQRQNNFDILTQIQNNPDPEFRIKRFTEFIRTAANHEGVNLAFVLTQRGIAYEDLHRLEEAERDFREAMRLYPDQFDSYLALGTLYAKFRKDYRTAIGFYEQAVALKPTLAVGYEMLGNAYSNLKDFDKAEEYYSKANDCGMELGEWYYNMALKLKHSGEDPTGAISESYYKRCISLNPHFMQAHINLAMIYRERNENDMALRILSDVVEGQWVADYKMLVLQRGICNTIAQKHLDALADFEWVLRHDPDNIQNLLNLATTSLRLARFTEAEYYARRGVEQARLQDIHTMDADLKAVLHQLDKIRASWKM